MNKFSWLSAVCLLCGLISDSDAQKKPEKPAVQTVSQAYASQSFKSSPAFAELILRKTELLADLESLLVSYTEEFPKVKELRFEVAELDKETARLGVVRENAKLTAALGKLLVRRAELATDVWSLQKKYGDEHPDVKRAKRKAEIYDNAVREILN